jgi:hypothetical protein
MVGENANSGSACVIASQYVRIGVIAIPVRAISSPTATTMVQDPLCHLLRRATNLQYTSMKNM